MGKDCKYCGAYISADENVCPACGKRVRKEKDDCDCTYEYSQAAKAQQAAQEREYIRDDYRSESYEQKNDYNPGGSFGADGQYHYKGTVLNSKEDDIRRNKAISFLCYLGPLFLIPYLTVKDSEFVKYHSNQGLLLLIASVIIQAISGFGAIGDIVDLVGTIFVIVCFIKGMQNVSRGIMAPLPVIGQFKILK